MGFEAVRIDAPFRPLDDERPGATGKVDKAHSGIHAQAVEEGTALRRIGALLAGSVPCLRS
jgi:hypothetical protein